MLDGGVLAIAPYALLSVAAASTAILFAMTVVVKVRPRHMLIGAAAMALLAVWFAALAITAGPAPAIRRADVAAGLRWLALALSLLWLVWLLWYARTMVRLEGR
jgi:hypothetical protein